ncbi:MAG: hypothetical protein ACNA8O_03340 [Cyanobacteriota bacterium]
MLRTVPAMELVIDAYELALIHALRVLRYGAGLITADRDLDAAPRIDDPQVDLGALGQLDLECR